MRLLFWKRKKGKRHKKVLTRGYGRLPSWREDAWIESQLEERYLIQNGLLEPDQPTPQAHARWLRLMEAPFSARERGMIRSVFFEGEITEKTRVPETLIL